MIEKLSKVQVRALADRIGPDDPTAIDEAVRFVCAETVNNWHGRGRAMMCRRLKHVPLSREQTKSLVDAILERLSSGRFSEQFRDQLRLALHLDREATMAAARREEKHPRPYVRRYASWILAHEPEARDAGT